MTNNSSQRTQGVVILGSTGSIGISTLDVVARHGARFHVVALTAHSQVERLFEQCTRFKPELAVMMDAQAAERLQNKLRAADLATSVLCGVDGLKTAAAHARAGIVMAAIVGAAGLLPTLAAVQAGKRVLLANKEPLVMCAPVLLAAAAASGAQLLPIDSEHNAIFQCLPAGFRAGETRSDVRRILLTCSGGPFRVLTSEAMAKVTPEQACTHPNWSMGRKISVDSATLMNKGLELIEACWLFGVSPDQVEIVIHPQSIVHSMVEYCDGSILAQLSNPDMRIPIAHALAWPERIESGAKPVDFVDLGRFDFGLPDVSRFPCVRLARTAAAAGGTLPAILNAANEVAVAAFLGRQIEFMDIAPTIEHALTRVAYHSDTGLDVVLADDAHARAVAKQFIGDLGRPLRQGAL